jgi:predicted NBD/HSP70 family sugar kinase
VVALFQRTDRARVDPLRTGRPEAILGIVSDLYAELLAVRSLADSDVLGVGIDVPGPVDFGFGRSVSPPIMTDWDRYDIAGWPAGPPASSAMRWPTW